MPPTLYWWLFCMIVWKSRGEVNTARSESGRDKYKTKSRKYILGSLFATVLTAITDTKDGKAIKIKCDPAYLADNEWKARIESE